MKLDELDDGNVSQNKRCFAHTTGTKPEQKNQNIYNLLLSNYGTSSWKCTAEWSREQIGIPACSSNIHSWEEYYEAMQIAVDDVRAW